MKSIDENENETDDEECEDKSLTVRYQQRLVEDRINGMIAHGMNRSETTGQRAVDETDGEEIKLVAMDTNSIKYSLSIFDL